MSSHGSMKRTPFARRIGASTVVTVPSRSMAIVDAVQVTNPPGIATAPWQIAYSPPM